MAVDRLARVFVDAPFGVAIVDAEGRFEATNRALQGLLGRSDDDLRGVRCIDVAHPDDHVALGVMVDADRRLDGEASSTRARLVRADGSAAWADIAMSGASHDDGRVAYQIVYVSDATALVDADEAHRTRTGTETERAQSEFLSRMSHELRTPLNSVLGFAQLLEMGDLRADQRDAVAQIMKAGAHLRDLLTDVLEYERAQSGRIVFSIESVMVESVVSDAIGIVAPLAREHVVRLATAPSGETWVHADRGRLRQVLLNLLTNAVKYNRAGGSVSVDVHGDGETVCIAVADTGRGIAEHQLQLLFTPFERLGAEATGADGAGVGLPLARSLAEGMGATIEVTSELGVGSQFVVRLEGARPPGARPRGGTRSQPPAQPRRGAVVLYVDDNDANVALVEQMLQHRGLVRVVSAPTVTDGVAVARRLRPDVVLLDLHLPDGTGQDVLEALRADPTTAAIPIVVVSADATPARINELLEVGAVAYVTKPIVVNELFAAMDLALGG